MANAHLLVQVMSVDPDAEVVVKLADLGVAKLKESNKEAMMTQGRGTPQYSTCPALVRITPPIRCLLTASNKPVAPEIFEKDENYSFPVDVYSFGLIIWEITTREQPYIDIKPHFKVREPAARMSDSLCSSDNSLASQIPLKVMAGERPYIPRDCPREWYPMPCLAPVPSCLSLQTHRFLSHQGRFDERLLAPGP